MMNQCTCGDMGAFVAKYGRPVHKELCPARGDDRFHQGDSPPLVHFITGAGGIASQEVIGGIK